MLPIVVALISALGSPWFPAGDNAVIELQTIDVPRHLPLYGVFSRYGFHHPGPALFLSYALPYRALGPAGLLVGAALVNALSLAGTTVYLHRRGGRPLLLSGAAMLLVFVHAFAGQLLDPWNSWVAVLPFAFAVMLAWSVWCGDRWALPLLAGVLSFAVQTHVGYALLAIWLLASAVVFAARRRQVRQLGVTAGVLFVCWSLPLWDQLRGVGNLGRIAGHFAGNTGTSEAVVGWSSAVGLLAREMGVRSPWLGGDEPVAAFTAGVVGASAALLVPLIVALSIVAVLGWRRRSASDPRNADAYRLVVLVAGTIAVGYVSVARITGEAYPYLIRWLWVVAILAWLAVLWWCWTTFGAQVLASRVADRRFPLGVASVIVGVLVVWASIGAREDLAPQPEFSRAIGALVDPVAAAAQGKGNLLLLPEGSSYGEVQSGLLPELERRGVSVMVRDEDAFKYGEHRKANGRAVDARLVVAVNQAVVARREAGSVPIATFDPLTPSERGELEGLSRKYHDQVVASERGEPVTNPMNSADVARVEELNRRGHLIAIYLDPGPIPPPNDP